MNRRELFKICGALALAGQLQVDDAAVAELPSITEDSPVELETQWVTLEELRQNDTIDTNVLRELERQLADVGAQGVLVAVDTPCN